MECFEQRATDLVQKIMAWEKTTIVKANCILSFLKEPAGNPREAGATTSARTCFMWCQSTSPPTKASGSGKASTESTTRKIERMAASPCGQEIWLRQCSPRARLRRGDRPALLSKMMSLPVGGRAGKEDASGAAGPLKREKSAEREHRQTAFSSPNWPW